MGNEINTEIKLFVGFGTGDITPPFPAANQGQFDLRITSKAENPLMANVVVMETKIGDVQQDHSVWISLDVSISSEELQNAISSKVSSLGIDPAHVFVSATHTHDAPFHGRNPVRTTMPGYEGELAYPTKKAPANCTTPEQYFDLIVDKASMAVANAWNTRIPATVGAGTSRADVGHCRYILLRNGKTGKIESHMYGYAATRPATDKSPSYEFLGFTGVDGDGTLETIGFWDQNGQLLGIVAGIHCPAQTSDCDSYVSPDYWGFVRQYLPDLINANVPLVTLCMFAGDIVPFNPFIPYPERTRLTEIVAKTVTEAIAIGLDEAKMNQISSPVLTHKRIAVKVPLLPVTEEKYIRAIEILSKDSNSFNEIGDKERYERMNIRKELTETLLLHAVRLGDIAIGTAPFEVFLPYGLELRKKANYTHVLPVQLTGGHYGYLPNADSVENPSYGVGASSGITGPEGGNMMVDELAKTLNDMK